MVSKKFRSPLQITNRSILSKTIPPPSRKSNRSSILSNLQLSMFSTVASAAATAMFLRSLATTFLPPELNSLLHIKLRRLLSRFSNETTLFIHEYNAGFSRNNLFSAAAIHVAAVAAPSAMTFRASLPPRQKNIDVLFCGGEEILDHFAGIRLRWQLVTTEEKRSGGEKSEKKEFRLSFNKEHKTKVVDEYLPYLLESSETLKKEKKTLKLFSLHYYKGWRSVNFEHPSKFETLAMDDEMKKMIMDDLDRFLKRKEFYKRVGKAWKRGYLLFGPPGTGKSSLIAAMANYLKFDVYDLELSSVTSDGHLRHLLMTTANRSILVVEDIDASIDQALAERKAKEDAKEDAKDATAKKQKSKVTLSGVLNFIDGLWSSMGDERIIIFTTNHKEKLDDALLRPGRMDVHLHMSYCTPRGFRLLVNNYLGAMDHPLVFKAEEMISSSKVTPAEIGEQLLKSDDPRVALEELIKFLEGKRSDNDESLKLKEISKEKDDDDDDGVTKLMNMAKALPSETRREILGKAEAADAFKILTRLLEEEVAKVNAKSLETSTSLSKSEGQNGVKVDK